MKEGKTIKGRKEGEGRERGGEDEGRNCSFFLTRGYRIE